MVMADVWYSSGTFWGAAGAVAVTVFGVIGIVAAYKQANPIQRLGYEMSQSPLLQDSAQALSGLKIIWQDREIREPHIIQIAIISHGRQDISRKDFEDQPLEFRLDGAEILAILRTDNSPESAAVPSAVAENAMLKVGPSHISRRQSTKFTLLAEGAQPVLRTPSATLHNVDLVNLSAEPSHRPHFTIRWAIGVTAAGVAAALVVLGILIARTSAAGPQSTPPARPTTSMSTPTEGLGVATDMAELKSPSQSSELSGITALQKLMKSSYSEQPAAIKDLVNFIRGKSPAGNNDQPVTTTVQAALNVLRNRNPVHDGGAMIVFDNTNLTDANLSGIDLSGASLVNTDFTTANLSRVNLRYSNLSDAYLGGANLAGADLAGATLTDASFYQTPMCNGSKPVHPAEGYNCQA
jgi:Pentapeptide repeats (8 copies)